KRLGAMNASVLGATVRFCSLSSRDAEGARASQNISAGWRLVETPSGQRGFGGDIRLASTCRRACRNHLFDCSRGGELSTAVVDRVPNTPPCATRAEDGKPPAKTPRVPSLEAIGPRPSAP